MKLVFSGSLYVSFFIISNFDNYIEVYVLFCFNYREFKFVFYIIVVSNIVEYFFVIF